MIGFYMVAAIAAIIPFISLIDLLWFLFSRERCFGRLKDAMPALAMIAPICVLVADTTEKNDCCTDSAIFSPQHRLTAAVLIALSILAFFYSVYRRKLGPPLLEVVVDCLLILGIGFDNTVLAEISTAPAALSPGTDPARRRLALVWTKT